MPLPPLPGDPEWPAAWMTYTPVWGREEDAPDLKAHGVGLVSCDFRLQKESEAEVREALDWARRHRMKLSLSFPEVTEQGRLVREAGLTPVEALMIGGVYCGRAVDRHLFSFSAGPQEAILEPPVYHPRFAYRMKAEDQGEGEPIAHYYPDLGPPARAEVVVPLGEYDGRQHLRILPARIDAAPEGARPEADTCALLPAVREVRERRLYRLRFDLTGLEKARLDQVGLAVYWAYGGTERHWIFGRGNVSAWAESTRETLRRRVRETLDLWRRANGGEFPHDVVPAARFGDECFYITGHLNGPSVNYPLWDFSPPAIAEFRRRAGEVEYPRTWGFPEIYGPEIYAWWRWVLHEGCAKLAALVREELLARAPGVLLFRNTTRMGVFDFCNDHDGSGQELLARNLDLVHLDPYPVLGRGYGGEIPRDMSYCAGLARRLRRPLVPWMQAHVYGGPDGLQHPKPGEIDRMAEEQYRQGVDAVIWLGYGPHYTFPIINRASWDRAGAFHRRLMESPPPKPRAQLAVLRPYRVWAQSSLWENAVRNPADWLLQQLLEVWAVRCGQPYDVFEVPPALSEAERAALETEVAKYPLVASTEPFPRAWVIGAGTQGETVPLDSARAVQAQFERELRARGWLR